MDRIDVDYLRRKPRVDISDETKLNADQQASDRFYSTTVDGTSNFISEIFFLTLAAHRYGTEATITKLEQLEKDLKHMEKQLQRLEAEREKWINVSDLLRDRPLGNTSYDPLILGSPESFPGIDAAAPGPGSEPESISRSRGPRSLLPIQHRGGSL